MPTRLPVRAYAFAATLTPKDVTACFAPWAAAVKTTKTQAVLRADDGGWAVVFDFGAVVFVAAPEEARSRALDGLLRALGPETRKPAEEELAVEVVPGSREAVSFDRLTTSALTQPVVELIALVLAQSVAMEYYEDDVAQTLASLQRLSQELAATGGFRGKMRALLKTIGRAMATRNEVVTTLALLDAPPMAWDSEANDRLYRELRALFEIEDRYRALDYKLRMIHDNLDLFVELVRHRRSLLLEAGVFLLVALEVLLFVYELARE